MSTAIVTPVVETIDVILLVPNQQFVSIASPPSKVRSLITQEFQELPFQIQSVDVIHELRSLIHEAPEGFWSGAFGLLPVESKLLVEANESEGKVAEYGPWQLVLPHASNEINWSLTSEGVLGDFSDLSGVYVNVPTTSKKGLKAIPTSFTHLAMSLHLLRLRETLYTTLPALTSGTVNDSTGLFISPGGTMYTDVRGKPKAEAELEVNGSKSKKATPVTPEEPALLAAADNPFLGFKLEDLNSYSAFDTLKNKHNTQASPSCRAFSISPWSPPPHARKLKGDLVYLLFTTLEGESYHITGATSGFWVSKSSTTTFDPSPRIPTPKGLKSTPYHTLFELFSALSPAFSNLLSQYIESTNPLNASPDVFATAAITSGTPAIPWLIPSPVHTADPFRSQLAYLLTSSLTAESLPTARDWIDEFSQYKELPKTIAGDKVLRDRLLVRVRGDFNSAAVRGCITIANGELPPLNPSDPPAAHTFVNNNMLFTRAEDVVKAFDFLGGDLAARVAAGKDLAAVEAIEEMDIDGISTLATVVVDYLGVRWIAQSLLPGLFKNKEAEEDFVKKEKSLETAEVYPEGSEEALSAKAKALAEDKPFPSHETVNKEDYPPSSLFRIVYGASSPDEPVEKVRDSAYFKTLAQQVAEKAHLAEHKVVERNGNELKLWTSSEMHGIAAPDGKSYFIDCYRLHCVDVEFLENNIAATSSLPAYPHSLLLLRSELLRAYRDSKLQKWIEGELAKATATIAAAAKPESVEGELKEAASDPTDSPTVASTETPRPTAIIDASNFVFNFNPDAFVTRKEIEGVESSPLLYDPEEESSKHVREASLYLRKVMLPAFLIEVIGISLIFTDGTFLTKLMHRKGINMRYLGMMVDLIDTEGETLSYKDAKKPDIVFALTALKFTLKHEMVSRAAKVILRDLLANSSTYDHPHVVSHFFNCLVGSNLESNPIATLPELPSVVKPTRTWTSLTPSSLQSQIIDLVALKFRFTLTKEFFTTVSPNALIRELCMRVGIQLLLRPYDFGSSKSLSTKMIEEESVTVVVESNGEGSKKRKKKASGGKETSSVAQIVSVRPEDVLNLYPIVKTTEHKSASVEENFIAGQRAFEENNAEWGQELISDSLNMAEQIFGSVHKDAASKYHGLGIVYYELGQNLRRRVMVHDRYMETILTLPEDKRKEFIESNPEYFIALPEETRVEAEMYLDQAVRMVRQSVIICERSQGLDSMDTISQFTDLGLLEQNVGNTIEGLRMLRHALNLWTAAYGPHHPSTLNVLNNAASMVQTGLGASIALPLHQECRRLAAIIYGEESHHVAGVEFVLAQAHGALADQLPVALKHADESHRIYGISLGETATETVESGSFAKVVRDIVTRDEAEAKAAAIERSRIELPRAVGGKNVRTIGTTPVAVEEVVVKEAHGQKADLSLDELVSFITGTSAKVAKVNGANKKRKGTKVVA